MKITSAPARLIAVSDSSAAVRSSMSPAAAAAGDLDERGAALESLTAIKRAGANVIFTYWAKDFASWL